MSRPFPEMAVHDDDAIPDTEPAPARTYYVHPCIGCGCPLTDCSCDYGSSFQREGCE
jgi:hypothetical protein